MVVGVVDGEVVAVVDGVDVMEVVCEEVAEVVGDVVGVDMWHSAKLPSAWLSIALLSTVAVAAQPSSARTMSPMGHRSCGVCSSRVYASEVFVIAFLATVQSCCDAA